LLNENLLGTRQGRHEVISQSTIKKINNFWPVIAVTHRLSSLSYNNRVMIAKDLREILVCPACKQALEYRQSPESLKCTQCHRVYAIKDDIPIMLIDEAVVDP